MNQERAENDGHAGKHVYIVITMSYASQPKNMNVSSYSLINASEFVFTYSSGCWSNAGRAIHSMNSLWAKWKENKFSNKHMSSVKYAN